MARDQRDTLRGATGKLKAAVRHWLGGGDVADETDIALAAFGLVVEEEEEEPFRVYAINWATLQVFWSTFDQWRSVTIGKRIYTGIDWAQVESVLKLSRIKRSEWPLIFEGLKAMQSEALSIMSET